jgi:hypothetical protein
VLNNRVLFKKFLLTVAAANAIINVDAVKRMWVKTVSV